MDSNQYLDDNAQPAVAPADTGTPASDASPYSFHPGYTPPTPPPTVPPEPVVSTPPPEPPAAVNVPINQPAEEKPELTTPPAEPELTTPPAEPELTTPAPEPEIATPPDAISNEQKIVSDKDAGTMPTTSNLVSASDTNQTNLPENTKETVKDILEKDIFVELGLSDMAEDEKRKMLEKFTGIIEGKINIRIIDSLDDSSLKEFDELMSADKQKEATELLVAKIPDLNDIVIQEIADFKKNFVNDFKNIQQNILAKSKKS